MNTKPYGDFRLQDKYLSMVGHQFYPPPTSAPYTHLQLDKFNIDAHRGSFLCSKFPTNLSYVVPDENTETATTKQYSHIKLPK